MVFFVFDSVFSRSVEVNLMSVEFIVININHLRKCPIFAAGAILVTFDFDHQIFIDHVVIITVHFIELKDGSVIQHVSTLVLLIRLGTLSSEIDWRLLLSFMTFALPIISFLIIVPRIVTIWTGKTN